MKYPGYHGNTESNQQNRQWNNQQNTPPMYQRPQNASPQSDDRFSERFSQFQESTGITVEGDHPFKNKKTAIFFSIFLVTLIGMLLFLFIVGSSVLVHKNVVHNTLFEATRSQSGIAVIPSTFACSEVLDGSLKPFNEVQGNIRIGRGKEFVCEFSDTDGNPHTATYQTRVDAERNGTRRTSSIDTEWYVTSVNVN